MRKDPQQFRIYRWEAEWGKPWNSKTLSQDECRAAIESACALYDVPAPSVHFRAVKRGWTFFDPNDHSIHIMSKDMNEAVCLHEAAHAIHWYVTEAPDHRDHGPEWFAIYLNLLYRCRVAPRAALTASADERGLAYGDLSQHSPRRLRATYRALWRRVQAARET